MQRYVEFVLTVNTFENNNAKFYQRMDKNPRKLLLHLGPTRKEILKRNVKLYNIPVEQSDKDERPTSPIRRLFRYVEQK